MYSVADVVEIYLFPHKCVDLELRWQTVIFIQIRSIHQATAWKKEGGRLGDRSAVRQERQAALITRRFDSCKCCTKYSGEEREVLLTSSLVEHQTVLSCGVVMLSKFFKRPNHSPKDRSCGRNKRERRLASCFWQSEHLNNLLLTPDCRTAASPAYGPALLHNIATLWQLISTPSPHPLTAGYYFVQMRPFFCSAAHPSLPPDLLP